MSKLHGDESAQDAFEYLLVIGGFVVVLFAGLLAFDELIIALAGHICGSVDTSSGAAAVGSCLGLS